MGVPSHQLQILALFAVVLLLLPVISLSDDLIAMQGPAETDSCLRRALHSDELHPSTLSSSFALVEPVVDGPATLGSLVESPEAFQPLTPSILLSHAIESRPPPRT